VIASSLTSLVDSAAANCHAARQVHQGATLRRCQGLTLDRAKVSLRNMFAEGQAYVALSRVRGMEGLEILGATKGCVKVGLDA
jgi:hypothetical protein